MFEVNFTYDIIEYQNNMDVFNRGDQHRVMCSVFSNVAHIKTLYNNNSLWIVGS